MKRLTVSLCALLLSVSAALGSPGRLDAAPPPPCPNGDTFIFCDYYCPYTVSTYCLAQLGYPANCRVEQPFCFDVGYPPGCQGWDQTLYHYETWCPYLSTI